MAPNIFVIEDIVLKIIEFIGLEQACLLRRINKCFNSTITLHFTVESIRARIGTFCSSVPLISWMMEDSNCPRDICREMCIGYAAGLDAIDVMQWCRAQDPPLMWDERCYLVAANEGKVSALEWLYSQNPPCPRPHPHQLLNAAREARQVPVVVWFKRKYADQYTEEEFDEDVSVILECYVADWLQIGDSHRLFGIMRQSLANIKSSGGDDENSTVLSAGFLMVMSVIQDDVKLTRQDVMQILAIVTSALHEPACHEDVLDDAIDCLRLVIQNHSKAIVKMNLLQPMIHQSMTILAESDVKPWVNSGVALESDKKALSAFTCLEALSDSVGEKTLTGLVLKLFDQSLNAADARQRKGACALIAAVAEGCADAFTPEMASLVSKLSQASKDPDRSVRELALFALQQCCEHCSRSILYFHEIIFQTICDVFAMDGVESEEQNLCCSALESLCRLLEPAAIEPFLPLIMEHINELLVSDNPLTREVALSAVHDIAAGAETYFLPHVQAVVDSMKDLLMTSDPSQFSQRGRALECLSGIARTLEKEAFKPYFELGLQSSLDGLQYPNVYKLHTQSLYFVANSVNILGKGSFGQHFDIWAPLIMKCLKEMDLPDGTEEEEDYDFEGNENEEDNDAINEGATKAQVVSSALLAIGILAKNHSVEFAPYMTEVCEIVDKLGNCYAADVREKVWRTYPPLIKALSEQHPIGLGQPYDGSAAPIPYHPAVSKLVETAFDACLGAVVNDDDEKSTSAAIDAIREITKHVGPFILTYFNDENKTYGDMIMAHMVLVLEGDSVCQNTAERNEDAEEDGNEGSEGDGADDRDDRAVLWSAFELIAELAKLLGPAFKPQFDILRPLLLRYTDEDHVDFIRGVAIGNLAEVIEAVGPAALEGVETLLPVIQKFIHKKSSHELRRDASFCLNVIIRLMTPATLAFHAPQFFKWLAPVCVHNTKPGQLNMGGADVDNALSALAHLIDRCEMDSASTEKYLGVLLNGLPLREDFLEAVPIYQVLVSIVQQRESPAVVQLTPELKACFLDALKENSLYPAKVKELAISGIKCILPEDEVEDVLSDAMREL